MIAVRTAAGVFLACMCLASPGPIADVQYVNGSCGDDAWTGRSPDCAAPDGPKRTIQAGLDSAIGGDVVVVAPGRYVETINFLGKSVTLRSLHGAAQTTIDATGLDDRVVLCESGEGSDTVLAGFTITGGIAPQGGGMAIRSSDPTVIDCVFVANRAEAPPFVLAQGGGMYIFDGDPTVHNCVFRQNTAQGVAFSISQGGGMYNEGGSPNVSDCIFFENAVVLSLETYTQGAGMCNIDSSPTVVRCDFVGNYTGGSFHGNQGGGMFNDRSSPTVTDCTFDRNFDLLNIGVGGGMSNVRDSDPIVTGCTFVDNVTGHGGAMHNGEGCDPAVWGCTFERNAAGIGGAIANDAFCNPMITFCTFRDNTASDRGGAIFSSASSPIVSHCVFERNATTGVGIWRGGGALYNSFESHTKVMNCVFADNSAAESGGAVFNFQAGSPAIINCTFTGNTSAAGGGVMYSTNTAFFESRSSIANCVFWGNGPDPFLDDLNAVTTITYSDVEGGFPGEGNIDVDPLFVDPNRGDYRLSPGSPAIDAGDPNFLSQPGDTDIDGQKRVWNGRVDMGSDEFGSFAFGDLNCDGAIDALDIEPFLVALFEPGEYPARFPTCDIELADINADGAVDALDIEPFLELLFGR